MKEILEQITMTVKAAFTEWFPNFLKMGLEVIGEFLDTFGYTRAIIIGISGLLVALITWILKKMNR